MLPYFPPAYSDELLYSLLARFYRHVGQTSPKRTLDVLFGNRSVRAGVLLQGHLLALSEELPPHRGLTPERLLADFTLYPYLTAFQPENVRRAVRDALFLGHAEWVTVRLGLAASRVQGATVLRYCPACRSEMLSLYGELYWRRDHQLPGVAVCPEHGARLQDSTVCPGAIGQHNFVAADEDNCPKVSSDAQDDVSIPWMVAKRCAQFLRSPPALMSLREWGMHYHHELRQRGFGKGDDRIDQRRLGREFAAWSGEPEMPGTESWPTAMVRKHRKAFHPLQHVLLSLFRPAFRPRSLALPQSPGRALWAACGPTGRNPSRRRQADRPVFLFLRLRVQSRRCVGQQTAHPRSRSAVPATPSATGCRRGRAASLCQGLGRGSRNCSPSCGTSRPGCTLGAAETQAARSATTQGCLPPTALARPGAQEGLAGA